MQKAFYLIHTSAVMEYGVLKFYDAILSNSDGPIELTSDIQIFANMEGIFAVRNIDLNNLISVKIFASCKYAPRRARNA